VAGVVGDFSEESGFDFPPILRIDLCDSERWHLLKMPPGMSRWHRVLNPERN
jgi:hypothetical protein